jgi:hypothetical protein
LDSSTVEWCSQLCSLSSIGLQGPGQSGRSWRSFNAFIPLRTSQMNRDKSAIWRIILSVCRLSRDTILLLRVNTPTSRFQKERRFFNLGQVVRGLSERPNLSEGPVATWYPRRSIKKIFKNKFSTGNCFQVLDARDPLGSRCKEVETAVLAASKRLVLVSFLTAFHRQSGSVFRNL